MRTTFLVGRLTPKSTEIVVTEGSHSPAPIPGPWSLRALVRSSTRRMVSEATGDTVH